MTHEEIEKALNEKGYTFTEVAIAAGYQSYQSITLTSSRKRPSLRAAEAIACALEKPVTEIFPDVKRFADGDPRKAKEKRVKGLQEKFAAAGLVA